MRYSAVLCEITCKSKDNIWNDSLAFYHPTEASGPQEKCQYGLRALEEMFKIRLGHWALTQRGHCAMGSWTLGALGP